MIEKRRSVATTHDGEGQEGRLRQLFQQHPHEVYHRQHGQTVQLLQQNTQEAVRAGFANNTKTRARLRLVWLQQTFQQLPKALALRTRFTDAGPASKPPSVP